MKQGILFKALATLNGAWHAEIQQNATLQKSLCTNRH